MQHVPAQGRLLQVAGDQRVGGGVLHGRAQRGRVLLRGVQPARGQPPAVQGRRGVAHQEADGEGAQAGSRAGGNGHAQVHVLAAHQKVRQAGQVRGSGEVRRADQELGRGNCAGGTALLQRRAEDELQLRGSHHEARPLPLSLPTPVHQLAGVDEEAYQAVLSRPPDRGALP